MEIKKNVKLVKLKDIKVGDIFIDTTIDADDEVLMRLDDNEYPLVDLKNGLLYSDVDFDNDNAIYMVVKATLLIE